MSTSPPAVSVVAESDAETFKVSTTVDVLLFTPTNPPPDP